MSALEHSPARFATPGGSRELIVRGAQLVHLAEDLYLRLFRLVMVLTIAGCALSVWFVLLSSSASAALTAAFAAGAAGFAALGLARPRATYLWLRYSRTRQLAPAAAGALMVLVNGPDSPSWWIAQPLLWVVADVSSTGLALCCALVTAAAYVAGTALAGQAVMSGGDTGILAAAAALPFNTVVGRLAAEVFARFALRLRRLESRLAGPLRVPNLAAPPAPAPQHPRGRPRRRHDVTRLTARQLEVAYLLRDGLRQGEIALCLGISPTQVQRLVSEAKRRSGAANTAQLVAMLVEGGLVPPVEDPAAATCEEQ